jgi:hypothetical protein
MGSISSTAASASTNALAARSVRPAITAINTTASITSARCVETEKPAKPA